jgi:hypothetical protein
LADYLPPNIPFRVDLTIPNVLPWDLCETPDMAELAVFLTIEETEGLEEGRPAETVTVALTAD